MMNRETFISNYSYEIVHHTENEWYIRSRPLHSFESCHVPIRNGYAGIITFGSEQGAKNYIDGQLEKEFLIAKKKYDEDKWAKENRSVKAYP